MKRGKMKIKNINSRNITILSFIVLLIILTVIVNAVIEPDGDICSDGVCRTRCPENCQQPPPTTPTNGASIRVKTDKDDPELWIFAFDTFPRGNCGVRATEEDGGFFGNADETDTFNAVIGTIIKKQGFSMEQFVPRGGGKQDAYQALALTFRDSINTKDGDKSLSTSSSSYRPKGDILCGADGKWYLCDSTFHDKTFTTGDKNYKCTTGNEWQETQAPAECDNDGKLEEGEECDKTDFGGKTCLDFGFTGGTLSCDSSCKFVKTSCTGVDAAPPCDYPGSHNPNFPVPNPPQTTKEKIGRIMMCYPPAESSMDNVVKYSNDVYHVGIRRHCCKPSGGPRSDTIDLADGTIIDLIQDEGGPNAKWQWIIPGGGAPDPESSKTACESAGFKWTGSKCCGEPEDKPEYYNDHNGIGGCWESKQIISVSFVEGTKNSVGNYKGQFYGCVIDKTNYNKENDNLLNLLDSNTKNQLIQNQNYCAYDPEKNYYCSFTEKWIETDGTDKSHLSYVPVQSASLQLAECCATTECWDGIKCVENQRAKPLEQSTNGYRCIDGNWKKLSQKCSPDGSTCAYCPEESQCLLNPLANNEPAQCIESDKYKEDSYCENGEWTSRTKLLALKLLKMKSNDYTLFCDNRENTLNNLQYVSSSNEVVANVLTNLQTNNFCILKAGNNIIAATSANKDFEEVPNSLNIFGVTSCSNIADDNQYHSCDPTNKVWYNKKYKSFIYSANAISVPSDSVSFLEFIKNPIRTIISIIKRLIVPSDQASLDAIKKFDRLYMTQQADKSVIGIIEGRNPINAVIEYKEVNTDICSFIEQFKRTKAPDLSIISCKKEDNKFYVLAQGSQFTNINPDSIWADLTSKLRLI